VRSGSRHNLPQVDPLRKAAAPPTSAPERQFSWFW
jgi:hypothetical protein